MKRVIALLILLMASLHLDTHSAFAKAKNEAADDEKKGYHFKPVHSEDWPETGDGEASQSDNDDRAPASAPPGMPKLRTLPDGSPDPAQFQELLNSN